MKFYKLGRSEGCEFVNFAGDRENELSWTIRDRSPGTPWEIPKVFTVMENVEGSKLRHYRHSDNLGTSHTIMSERAYSVLGETLSQDGEFLTLQNVDGTLCYLFLAGYIPALDLERSELRFFPNSSDRVMAIRKYEFLADVVNGRKAFRVSHGPAINFFCQEVFDVVRSSALEGFEFRLVWESSGED